MPTLNLNPAYTMSKRAGLDTKYTGDMWSGPADNNTTHVWRAALRFSLVDLPAGSTVTNVAFSIDVNTAGGAGEEWYIGPYNADGTGNPETDSGATTTTRCDVSGDYYTNTADFTSTGVKTFSDLGATARTDVAAQAEGTFSIAIRQVAESTAYTYADLDGTTTLPVLTIDYTTGGGSGNPYYYFAQQ